MEKVIVSNEMIAEDVSQDTELAVIADMLLSDVRSSRFREFRALSVPFSELSTLGSGVSSLLPAFRTVTQTSTVDLKGYFQLANAEAGDRLKVAKNGYN